jgi:CRP-like cAMP-binding protein
VVVGRIRRVDREAAPSDTADVALLRDTPIFGPLGLASLERVARNLIPVEVPSGAIVIREGEAGDRFYVIARGAVEVSRDGEPIANLGPGDFVGEIALLRNVPRTATVTATEPTTLRALERSQFLAAVTGSPAGEVALEDEMDRRIAEHGS